MFIAWQYLHLEYDVQYQGFSVTMLCADVHHCLDAFYVLLAGHRLYQILFRIHVYIYLSSSVKNNLYLKMCN